MKTFSLNISKRTFLCGFAVIVALLAGVRWACPSVAGRVYYGEVDEQAIADSILAARQLIDYQPSAKRVDDVLGGAAHRAVGVDSLDWFTDMQDVQKESAELHGIEPVQNREEAEQRKDELVYIGSNPYFDLRELTQSVPYLVPCASLLLQDIGRNFMDSLSIKNLAICRPYVTSVLRTKDDVTNLMKKNKNATQKSCHLYGTTFDIIYTRFSGDGEDYDSGVYKDVLAEVLRDLRNQKRCWVKYEKRQPVFHITVR